MYTLTCKFRFAHLDKNLTDLIEECSAIHSLSFGPLLDELLVPKNLYRFQRYLKNLTSKP